ncbi:large conductance mechanosensitive channel protein MscL [Ktedonosporobacter rubrisoli]|uniref:Large conductance mechanosensitive channel protein MscL n=1 Tax=Ktedonosporobacter rubrisoli TaxID=2509675 RepID=A0A4P6JUC9_KTERU|nr:large conductance mechanosensitive channel protein MscL [Ktedonosporobacter rubrisoli]QBD79074.1 large conductance mechanosensitive channel protein MscL [Ktedonosporobacter rubrisoli]
MDRERAALDVSDIGKRGLHAGLRELGGFQKFILRGNVVDLAVGIVIGASFNSVVTAMVNDFLQPLIGKVANVSTLNSAQTAGFMWGHFIGTLITFLLTAAVVYFFVVRPVNALQDRFFPHKDEAPTTRECPFCLSSVPIKATRCAYCTAQLPPSDTPETQTV